MKVWGGMAMLLILGSWAGAESLGDAAKRERERREKNKQAGTASPVIHEEDLAGTHTAGSKGTFSPAAGSTTSRTSAPAAGTAPSAASKGAPRSDVDIKRAAARDRLESSYQAIAGDAWSLVEAVRQFGPCRQGPAQTTRYCLSLVETIGELAISVGAGMDDAEDAARQGWLPPGEVRAIRQRYRMYDAFWDELGRAVRQYRR